MVALVSSTLACEASSTNEGVVADVSAGAEAGEVPLASETVIVDTPPDADLGETAPVVQEVVVHVPPDKGLVIRHEEPHRDIATPCFPGIHRDPWQFENSIAWSPDGSAVLFTRGPEILAVSADGSQLWPVVVPAPNGVGPMTAFDITPDGARIVYSTCDYPRAQEGLVSAANEQLDVGDYEYEIAVVAIDGGEAQRLTTNGSFDNYPAWSPEGSQIAYISGSTELVSVERSSRLHVMQSDGTGRQPLWGGLDAVATDPPAWSPDGRWVAAAGVSDTGGRLALHLISIESGQEFVRLSDAVSGAWSWSPDGQRLAFAKREGARLGLYTVAVDGTDAQRVTTIEGWRSWWPSWRTPDISRTWVETVAWSPDGSKILYSCNGICVVTPDGSPVGPAPLPGNLAAWSPNGSRIVTISTGDPNPNRRDNPVISIMAPDGSDLRVLVQEALGGLILAQFDYADVTAAQAACAAGHVVDAPAENPGLVRDCETLLGLRDALFGRTLANWGPGTPIAEWVGVTVAGEPSRVTGLMLDRLVPNGPIPAAVGDLAQLRMLALAYDPSYHRRVAGPIPSELGDLSQLRVLVVSGGLTGSIPPELGQLANLRILSLATNKMTGEIPPELGQLTNLLGLYLHTNQLTGPIPAELGQLTSLTGDDERILDQLTIDLAGAIDVERVAWGQLIDFTGLSLHKNRLSGSIPPEFGQLTQLTELNLYSNQLTGPIPPELGQLTQLIELDLHSNHLTGHIPAELGQLAHLQGLSLFDNQLEGTIPAELGQLTRLTGLYFNGNQLTGLIPAWLGQLAHLQGLSLADNQLTGAIPAELGRLAALRALFFAKNQLTGVIPTELGQLVQLTNLSLNHNQLNGPIPAELGQLASLEFLRLGANQFTGCIPPAVQRVQDNDLASLGLAACEPA